MKTKRAKKTETKTTASARKARKKPATGKPEHPPPGLTREHVKTLPEREKNALRAEALDLLTKGQAATGTEALRLSAPDRERLAELIRCGMLPGDPPPAGVARERLPVLRDMARQRFDAMRNRRELPLQWYANEAEANWSRAELFRLNSNALGDSLARLAPGNEALRAALLNTLTDKTEAIRKATPDPKTLTPIQREWLALRVTEKGKTVKYGATRWPSQRDIAAALCVGKNVVNRMETELEARADVRAFLAVMRVPLRKPRGNPKPTGTKRKIACRA